MKLPKLAIKNYQFTIVIFALLLILGVSSYVTMPRMEDPPIYIPGASVTVIYPGANPYDLENLVTDPLEEALNELDDIKRIQTTMLDGIATISVEFNFKTDPDEKFNEVLQKVNATKNSLPEDIYDINVMQWSSTDVNILQLAFVSGSASFALLNNEAEKLKKEIERINGVKKVGIDAVPDRVVSVQPDIEKMSQMNISLTNISNVISGNNTNIPGGSMKISGKNFNIKTSGPYQNLDEIRNTAVGSYQGRVIYLRDIAIVSFEDSDNNYYARFNGKRAIFLSVQQKEGFNIFNVVTDLKSTVKSFKAELPSVIRLETVFDQSESVDARINGFMGNLVQGIILVGLVIFLALGVRASVLVIIAIPFSILIGLGFVDLSGFGLQQISIAALVIALGLLVDNSIVIVENIERYINKGYNRKKAAIKATSELGWPVISATATTMLAFIPIIMMPDKAGAFIKSLPVTVIYTLAASLLLALTLTPFLASRFLRKRKGGDTMKKHGIKKLLQGLIEGPYRNTMHIALRRPWLIILLALLLLGGAVGLFFKVGVSFFPKAEKPQFMIRVKAPESSNIDKTDQVARYVESVLDTIDEVKRYATNVGHGNPRIYYNIFPKSFARYYAEIYVELKEYDVDSFDNLVTRLRTYFGHYPGARINIKELEQGTPIEAPVALKISGDDMKILSKIAADAESFVNEAPGAINVDNQLDKVNTDIYFHINRDKAALYGVPVVLIDRTLRTCIAGAKIAKYHDARGNEYDIEVRLPYQKRLTANDFNKIYVTSLAGKQVPLRQLATVEFKSSQGIITHYNLSRDATITADIEKGYSLDDVIAAIKPHLKNYPWPAGYEYHFAGELESRQESFGGMQKASIIALIAIFAVLVLQFRSLTQPLIIFSAIPLAVIGSVLALYITGHTFSFTAFIGLVSLIGIVVNNSIILVDYSNQLLREGKNINEAVLEAGETRFVPIILTTLTTIGGLLPLTLRGGTLWAPMGWTIIGGLFVSTFLTLIVVPVLYQLLTSRKEITEPVNE